MRVELSHLPVPYPICFKTPHKNLISRLRFDSFDDEGDDFDEEAMLQDDSLVKVEEGSSQEVQKEEVPNESTLGAKLLFQKF